MAVDGRKIRVLVVDDSTLCRDLLAEILEADPALELAGSAVDGADAVEKVVDLAPDVVTMDLRMPKMDGIEATTAIMEKRPTPILVLTGHPFQSGRNMTFDAIRAGALDLMIKPDLGVGAEVEQLGSDLARMIKFVAQLDVTQAGAPAASPAEGEKRPIAAVAMAASVGGPRAVHSVLSALPADFPTGIVLVQHITEGFVDEFAAWLDSESELRVRVAEQDDEVVPGQVLVAPAECHVRLMPGGHCKLIRGQPINGYRPSADVLFSSLARVHGELACGVILSGMGEDGVTGLSDIKSRGGLTLVQDEGPDVGEGMPHASREKGAAEHLVALENVAAELVGRCGPAE